MKKYFKEIIVIAALICIVIMPISTQALFPAFGGLAVDLWPCTCSGAIWLWFAPLYLQGIPMTGPMNFYFGGTYQYMDYLGGAPGVSYLGDYIPGVQSCWIYAGYFCFPLPAIGHMARIGTAPGK